MKRSNLEVLIERYGPHCTLVEAMAREARTRLLRQLGLPVTTTDAALQEAAQAYIERALQKGNPS